MAEQKWARGYGEILPIYGENGEYKGAIDTKTTTGFEPGQEIYSYNNDGQTVYVHKKEDIPTWIDLNKDTGDIDIHAPDVILNSTSYKNTIKPLLTQLSSSYKTNKDYKVPNPFDENDEAEYSVEEIVRKIQDGINQQQIALGQYARTKDAIAQRVGEGAKDRLTPERYAILMANGLSGKDDDIISIPKTVSHNLRWKNFFEMADSFNGNEMTVKDFKDVYYHTDAGRDIFGYDNPHEMKEWVRKHIDAMESRGIENMSDEDFDEYLRLQAFNNYLSGNEPRKDVINGFIENIFGTAEGVARGTADFTSGIVSLADGIWNRLWGLESGSEAYKRFGNPASRNTELITTIAANSVSIPISGSTISSDDLVLTDHVSSELRKLYDERSQYYVDTNRDAATLFMVGYAGAKITANIIAGKAISGAILGSYARWLAIKNYDKVQAAALLEKGLEAFPETVGLASGGGTMATGHIMSGTEAINTFITGTANPNMYQLISGLSSINPADVVNMSKLTVGMAAESQSTLAFVQAFKNMLDTNRSLKNAGRLLTIGDLLAQTTLDTALQDPVATRKVLEGSYTQDELSVVWENAAWNFGGYLGSLLIGKMISSFPKTATGKAANEAATQKLWQIEGWLSDRRDQMKEMVLGKDWLNDIKNPGKKQVARYKWILNKAGENIAKSGGDVASTMKMGKVGQTTEEAIRQMRAVENAISQREAGVGVKLREFRSDAHPSINNSIKQLESSTSELAKLLTDAGYKPVKSSVLIGGTDPNMGFTPELNNYVGSVYYKRVLDNKLKANNSVISYEDEKLVFPGTAKFTDAQKRAYPVLEANIKRYEEMFPKNITDYVKNTYIPNLYSASVAIRNYRMNPKVSLDLSEEIEGFISTGMWGEKGDEFIPMMRITEAQKEYAEELNRNFQKTEKTGFIRNRNKGPEAIQWGSEADFVNPTLAVERYLTQTAYEEINQSGLRTVLDTPTIKNNTLFDGEQTGAARTFKNLEPALDKAVNDGLGGVKTKFDKSYIADLVLSEYTVKADIAKAEAKQKRAEKELKKIAEEAPKINPIDRSRALQTMSNENITNVLNDAYKERAKSGSYLDEYKSAATIEDVLQDKSAYDKFILNSPIGVRRAIKRAVNGYQQLTGTVFSETGNTMRGRLNSLVPGCDVYDWGLLGREFTNGLTNEGLYTFKGGTPEVQAYIMSTDDLRKLTGLTSEASYVKNHKNEGDATRVLKELTVENVQGVIPVKRLGDMFIPGSEFGHAGITAITSIEWYKYFDYLDSKGITSVPVAISQLPLPKPVDFGTPEYINRSKSTSELLYERQLAIKDLKEKSALREQWEANDWKTDTGADVREQQQSKNGKKLPGTSKLELLDADIKKAEDLIGQYDKYSIDNSVNDKLGHTSQNITEDMKQMFDEEGYVPLFHNQWDDYGSIEFNAKDNVPTGTGVYTAKNGWGDAYWIAPNKRYTDTYGDHKLIAKIPTESLLTGKELDSVVKDFSAEKQKLIDAGVKEKIQNTYDDLYKKVGEKLGKSDSAIAEEVRAAYADGYITEDESLEMYATKQLNNSNVSSEEKDLYGQFLDYYGYNTKDDYVYKDGAGDYIKDEDAKKYMDLDKYVDDYGHVNSFRAISEKTGKPMIDTSMDELVQANSKGTAYFYYKDVDPEFDQKMLKQLSVQAESEKSVEKAILRKTNDVIKKKTLSELIDIAGKNIDQDKLKKLKDAIDNAKTRVEKAGAYHNLLDNIANENRTIVDALGTTTQDYLARNSKKLSEVTLKDVYDWGGINLKKGNKELLDELGIEVKVKPGEWEKADITRAENVPVHSAGFEPKKTANQELAEDYGGNYDDYFTHLLEDYTSDSGDSINSLDNPYLPAPVDDPSLKYDAFKLVTEINPDVITDVNRAMLKADKDVFKASDLITTIAQNQKKARIELAATIKFEEASRTLGLPTINSRAKLIGAIDDALDGVTKSILEDENAVKVLDAIMVEQDAERDVAREYIAMVYLKKHEKEIKQAAQDVFKYDKFKNAAGKMPGTTIAKMENQLSKEIGRCIDSKLDEARNAFIAAGGEVVDGDKVLKEIHELMNEIEEAGHDANVVAVRRNGQEELIETDPIVADVFNYHVIDESSNVEKFLNNPVFKGMNRLSRFFQVTISPTSMRNQYIRDPLSMFVGTGGIPIRDGMKHISKELLATYDEQIVKEFSEMFPSEAKYIKENLKEGEKYEEKILESIMATGSSTSPALTKTAFYKDPFEGTNVSENFWGVLDQTKSTIGKIVNKAGDFAESAHQAREVYLRNAQYAKGLKDGLDAGMSLEDAMEMARFFRDNGTTNFRNELYHLRAFAKTVNYFGAAINGYTSFWRLFSLDPVGVSTRLFGGIIVPIIVATGMSLASDENRKRYEGLKEYEKNEQFIFVMNGQVYRIPLPQELSVIINPIRHSVETLYGQDKHAFWELMMTDLLNIGPVKFGDIMDLDRNEFDPDPSILDRFGQLGLSLIDQTMPLAIKTIFSLATGIDTYTGQPIDTSYWSFDEEGNRILVGGTQSQFSLKLGKETGWSPSVIAWASKSLFGTVGRDVLDVVLGGASPTTLVSNSLGAMSLTASDYDRTASDWNKKIADLWNQKEAKYLPMYNDYTDKINKETDPEKKQKLINKRKDEMKPFFDQVKNMVKTLNDKYPGMYDRYRFSAVTSLLIFDNGVASGTDAASRERDLKNFYLNRDRARQWMSDLGISASDSDSILGHLEMGKDGTIGVKINDPLEVLSAQSLFYDAKNQHVANIAMILESGTDSYKNQLKAVKNQITDIYNKGKLTQADYDRIDDIKIDWDKKVIAALAPYVQKYSAESAINNDKVLEYLSDYLYVPDAFKKNNRGYNVTNKSLNYLGNAEDAFKESFIKYAFGVNDNKYEHSWNFSNHKTLGGK